MFGGVHLHTVLLQRCSALRSDYEVRIGIDDGLFRKVNPLELVAVVVRSRQNRHDRGFPCMKADSREFNGRT